MFNIFKPKVTDEQVMEVIKPMLAEMEERVNWLQSMQKLDVKDGDIVVLRHPGVLAKDSAKKLKKFVRKIVKGHGFDVHVMVFEEGMEIGVLRKGETNITVDIGDEQLKSYIQKTVDEFRVKTDKRS